MQFITFLIGFSYDNSSIYDRYLAIRLIQLQTAPETERHPRGHVRHLVLFQLRMLDTLEATLTWPPRADKCESTSYIQGQNLSYSHI